MCILCHKFAHKASSCSITARNPEGKESIYQASSSLSFAVSLLHVSLAFATCLRSICTYGPITCQFVSCHGGCKCCPFIHRMDTANPNSHIVILWNMLQRFLLVQEVLGLAYIKQTPLQKNAHLCTSLLLLLLYILIPVVKMFILVWSLKSCNAQILYFWLPIAYGSLQVS